MLLPLVEEDQGISQLHKINLTNEVTAASTRKDDFLNKKEKYNVNRSGAHVHIHAMQQP